MTEKSKKIIDKALKKQRKIIDFVDKAIDFYSICDYIGCKMTLSGANKEKLKSLILSSLFNVAIVEELKKKHYFTKDFAQFNYYEYFLDNEVNNTNTFWNKVKKGLNKITH